jgi:hypothetical protein
MQLHSLTRAARVLGASTLVVLALAVPAGARLADNFTPQTSIHHQAVPTVVRQTVIKPGGNGLGTLALVLIGVGAAAAMLGAGYLGARIATRTSGLPFTRIVSAKSSTPTHRGHASRTDT